MRELKESVVLLLLLVVTACGNMNESLEHMIPADATGVVCFDMPQILKESQLLSGDKISIPASLQTVVDDNDDALLCKALTDLPVLGLDTRSKAYAFFTLKTFGRVLLLPLADEDAARKTIAQRAGSDFAQVEGIDCIYVEDNFYAIARNTLLVGAVNVPVEREKAARAAATILQAKARNITDVPEVLQCIHGDAAVNAFFKMDGVRALLKRSSTYNDIAQRMPLVEVFTQSDIKALTCAVSLERDSVTVNTQFIVDENSDYMKLINSTTGAPDAEFLNVMPSSMEYIMGMSVKGKQFVQLAQIRQLLKAFARLPYIGRLDLAQMLSTIDGPVAVGLARDPNLEGEWNAVIAARCSAPGQVVNTIGKFAMAMGQAPELYDNEYVYQYDNKMIRVGAAGKVFYLKMLNYEQTEANAGDDERLRTLFAASPFAMSVRTGAAGGHLTYGLADMINGHGTYTPASADVPATLSLLQMLCGIKPAGAFDDMLNDDSEVAIDAAIDGFHELN